MGQVLMSDNDRLERVLLLLWLASIGMLRLCQLSCCHFALAHRQTCIQYIFAQTNGAHLQWLSSVCVLQIEYPNLGQVVTLAQRSIAGKSN